MCYYNGIRVSRDEFIRLKEMEAHMPPLIRKVQNGFDYRDWPIVKPIYSSAGIDKLSTEMAHWEFRPTFLNSKADLKEFRKRYLTFNAKVETLFESRMYKNAAMERRCLIPSSGFFEWRHYMPEGEKKKIKYPYYISVTPEANNNRDVFFMAGIWQTWTDKMDGETIDTFSLVTREAPEGHLMASVHNSAKRMPLIFTDDLAWEWLNPNLTYKEVLELGKFVFNSCDMNAYSVDKGFLKAIEPTQPYTHPGLPPLEGFENPIPEQAKIRPSQMGMFD